jgi:hypothetical protein
MISFLAALPDATPVIGQAHSLTNLEVVALLDFSGLTIAIWTFWSSIWLHLGGNVFRAFRLISIGGLAFALSHLLDTILQLLDIETATLIHQGAVLLSVLFFLPGLASLADAVPSFKVAGRSAQHSAFWPISVCLTLGITAASFILYGINALAETVAFVALDGSIVLLAGACLILVVRARLGGGIGRSLWQAMLGLIIFSMAHPVQVWFYEQATYSQDTLAILHRLIVIPAFCLFAVSMTSVARTLSQNSIA